MPTYRSLVQSEIAADRPTRTTSTIDVPDSGRAASVSLTVDLHHDRPSDLRLWLVSPSGHRVLVRERLRGGLASDPIEVPALAGESLTGRWGLLVDDVKPGDGGVLSGWQMDVATYRAAVTFDLVFLGGLTASQRDVFRAAFERIQRFIVGTKTEPLTCRIEIRGLSIDGEGGTLGQAGPRQLRSGDMLPTLAIIELDEADISGMERTGALFNAVVHEGGHSCGFGTTSRVKGLVENNRWVGAAAMREYGAMLGGLPTQVQMEDGGGQGTYGSHWEEEIFGSECFTGYINQGQNPVSRMSVGAFDDMGYEVDYSQADPYVLGMRRLVAGPTRAQWHGCRVPQDFEIV